MTALEITTRTSRQSNWMIPVITDLLRFEYEIILREESLKRINLINTHRAFWDALFCENMDNARMYYSILAKDYASLNIDLLTADAIDSTIVDNLSEMILVRSKTQKSKSRVEIKLLLRSTSLRGEVLGRWHAHQYSTDQMHYQNSVSRN